MNWWSGERNNLNGQNCGIQFSAEYMACERRQICNSSTVFDLVFAEPSNVQIVYLDIFQQLVRKKSCFCFFLNRNKWIFKIISDLYSVNFGKQLISSIPPQKLQLVDAKIYDAKFLSLFLYKGLFQFHLHYCYFLCTRHCFKLFHVISFNLISMLLSSRFIAIFRQKHF